MMIYRPDEKAIEPSATPRSILYIYRLKLRPIDLYNIFGPEKSYIG